MKFYPFGMNPNVDPEATDPAVVGGKGAGLVWMTEQGVSVPPGFIIPTTVWAEYDKKPKTTMKAISKMVPAYLEALTKHFGYLPLLSVRSGARVSCPGMMDTILNVGIDTSTANVWQDRLGAECLANSYHRLIEMYGSVVHEIPREAFGESVMTARAAYLNAAGSEFPDAAGQLLGAIEAVFKSWDNDRADFYRKLNKIPREWGTAVTIQAMVFGNLNANSGSGVLFTRNPDTGEASVTGEYLVNAQGEDVVNGSRTGRPLSEIDLDFSKALRDELVTTVVGLEKARKDMQDVEFTIQDGKLYILQTRNAKRSAVAALRVAMDMANEGLVSPKDAINRVSMREFDTVQSAFIDPAFKKPAAFTGMGVCSGVVTGRPVFSKEEAIKCKTPCILIANDTTPDDVAGMYAAVGVITMVGGMTAHAAVVARTMNRACVVGVGQNIEVFREFDTVSLDGETGRIWPEAVPIVDSGSNKAVAALVAEFNVFVAKTLGIVPVITEEPAIPMETALLYLGNRLADYGAAAKVIVNTAHLVKRLYVDLLPENGAEAEFMQLIADFKPANLIVELLESMTTIKELKPRMVFIGDGLPVKTLRTVATGTDLRSLIMTDGEILIGEIADDEAINRVMVWRKDELKFVSLGKYLPNADKSMLSMPQALQLVKGGGVF